MDKVGDDDRSDERWPIGFVVALAVVVMLVGAVLAWVASGQPIP